MGAGSGNDNGEGDSQGSGAALAPIGRSGSPRRGMGGQRGQIPDPRRQVLPSRRGTRAGQGAGGGGGAQAVPDP